MILPHPQPEHETYLILPWIGIGSSKFSDWKDRFGKVNEHTPAKKRRR